MASLTGPLQDLVIRASDRLTAQYSSLEIKFSSMEETVYLAQNQAEAAQKDAHEWKKRYELAMADYKKASENSSFQYSALHKKVTTFKERQAVLTTELEETRKEASEWQVKYERLLLERQRDEERLTYQLKSLQVHKINVSLNSNYLGQHVQRVVHQTIHTNIFPFEYPTSVAMVMFVILDTFYMFSWVLAVLLPHHLRWISLYSL